jgi:hypothetical protein
MNKLKPPPVQEEVEETPAPEPRKRKKPSALRKNIVRLTSGVFGIFDRNQIVQLMPFILFVSLLIVGYIANSYYAERMIREIDKTKVELKERRAEYISTMSRLMYQSNQSEVAKVLNPYEIKESTQPPSKIFITENKKK